MSSRTDAGRLEPWAFETRRVDKPWGHELIWALSDVYCGKVLFVKAGQSLSLQYHEAKDESWLIQSGRAKIELGAVGDDNLVAETVGPGAAFRYRPGTVHRITAVDDTTILEVSTPQIDDVVRLADSYGRAGTSAA
jgi:mannose-6-phosphate isomerase